MFVPLCFRPKENVSELVQRIAVQTVVIFVLPIGEIVAVVQGHFIGVPRISRQDRIQQRTLEPSSDAQSFQEQIEVRTRKWIIPVSRRMVDIVEIDKVTPHEAVLSDR